MRRKKNSVLVPKNDDKKLVLLETERNNSISYLLYLSAEKSHLYTREVNNAGSDVLDVQGDMHKKREHC